MAKVLMVNPIVREEDDPRHIPYGIAMLASIIEQRGHEYQIFDGNAWRVPESAIPEIIQADTWDVVAIGGITTTYGYVKMFVEHVKRLQPNAMIIAGGGLVTSMPADIMTVLPAIDVGVVGEAFGTFPELLEKLDRGEHDWANVLGVAYRDAQERVQLTPARPMVENLDTLPYPKWEAFPLDIYFSNSMVLASEESMVSKRRLDINGSFGCPFVCRFCFHLGLAGDMEYIERPDGNHDVYFTQNRVNRMHSPRYIVEMVKYLRKTYQVDLIGFIDENLLAINVASKNTWLPELCRLWIEEGLQPQCVRDGVPHDPEVCTGVHWTGTSHAGIANPDILNMMRNAGCSYLIYGLESFSDRILRTLGKGASAAANERSVQMTLDAGIRPVPNQIIGFPEDFFDSIRDCMEAWDRMGIQVKPFFATPYPGSEWFFKYKDKILAQYDGDLETFLLELGDATKLTANICQNFNDVELLGLRELMVNRDYKRIAAYEKAWHAAHGKPTFTDVRWEPARRTRRVKTHHGVPVEQAA